MTPSPIVFLVDVDNILWTTSCAFWPPLSPGQIVRSTTEADMVQLSINTIRTLSIDAVQQAKSGHPGTPMALAPLV